MVHVEGILVDGGFNRGSFTHLKDDEEDEEDEEDDDKKFKGVL